MSVVSIAVRIAIPIFVDASVKVETPLAFVVLELGEIVSMLPREDVRVTVFPETTPEVESLSVTVIVDLVEPSAGILAGYATTLDVVVEGTGAAQVTAAV